MNVGQGRTKWRFNLFLFPNPPQAIQLSKSSWYLKNYEHPIQSQFQARRNRARLKESSSEGLPAILIPTLHHPSSSPFSFFLHQSTVHCLFSYFPSIISEEVPSQLATSSLHLFKRENPQETDSQSGSLGFKYSEGWQRCERDRSIQNSFLSI